MQQLVNTSSVKQYSYRTDHRHLVQVLKIQ